MGIQNTNFRITTLVLLLSYWFSSVAPSAVRSADGFWYGEEAAKKKPVLIEAFLDPVCPDSRDAWTPLKKAIQHYGSRVALVVHTFPLPYHDNAYVCSRALHIINKLNSSATYRLLEAIFENQEQFYNKATVSLSRADVVDQMGNFITRALGPSLQSAIQFGFADSKTDLATRVSFKFGCTRGVYGTPFFFVNGFPLPDAGSPIDYVGWENVIDPLVKEQGLLKDWK